MKKTIRDIDVAGKRVLLRVDFNVPVRDEMIIDDARIQASLPTLNYLIEHQARVIVLSHRGRPNGFVVESLRMDPIAARLSELLGQPVEKVNNCIGEEVQTAVNALQPGQVLCLENVRFHPGEIVNDTHFTARLASIADIYVDDAFASMHRINASIVGVPRYIPGVMGLLVENELLGLRRAQNLVRPPVVAVLGGVRLVDKTRFIDRLLEGENNRVLFGGVLANTLLRVKGWDTGQSQVEMETSALARAMLASYEDKLTLPVDVVAAESLSAQARRTVVAANHLRPTAMIADIGPETIARYSRIIDSAGTVIFNGLLGAAEIPAFAQGTEALAKKIASLPNAVKIAGGGDTMLVLKRLGLSDQFNYLSTGGASFLEALENRQLPGIAALQDQESEERVQAGG